VLLRIALRSLLPVLVFVPTVAFAEIHPAGQAGPLDSLLDTAPDPGRVRVALLREAARTHTSRPDLAARALYLAGTSYDRGGQLDSALACFEGAATLGAEPEAQDAWAEALFARGGPGDATLAESVLTVRLARAEREGSPDEADARGRLAWAAHLEGRADTAASRFGVVEPRLLNVENPLRWMWRYRIAAALVTVDPRHAYDVAKDLVVRSRATDQELVDMLRKATGDTEANDRLHPLIRSDLIKIENEDKAAVADLGGRRLDFRSDDGFALSSVVLAPPGRTRRRAAVVMVDRTGDWADFDSLATALRRAGWVVMLLDPRGSGRSIDTSCPSPESWRGREEEMEVRTARDVRIAVRELARAMPVDTTRFLLIGSRDAAHIAIDVARDRRVAALVLVSPEPPEVEMGRARARLAARRLPVYFQGAVMDADAARDADRLFHATDGRVSRIVDSRLPGNGAQIYRLDQEAFPRLKSWLDGAWAAPAKKKPAATPPAPRR
jgi:dienelactone hydrolase